MVRGFGRRRPQTPTPVEISSNLDRLDISALFDYAETEIMMAGHFLSHFRDPAQRAMDRSGIDQAVQHAEWAVDALKAIRERDRPGVA